MKNHHKISIALLIALVGFPQISETIYTPALPDVAVGLHTSAHMVEATLAIYFVGFALGVMVWGIISDYCGRRMAMLAGLLAYGIGTYKCSQVDHVKMLLAWRFFQAFGASVGSVVTQTILRDSYEGAERTKLFSIMAAALAFSPAIGPLLGGFIIELLGWRGNFWILTGLAILLFVWTGLSLPETRPAQLLNLSFKTISRLGVRMMRDRPLWGHILLIGMTNSIVFGFYQEAPFVFIEQLGMQPSHYGFFGLLIAAATILAAGLSYRLSSRYSSQVLIQWGARCVLLGGIALTATVALGILEVKVRGIVAAVSLLFVIFFGVGLIIPNSLSHALKSYQDTAGAAGSIFGGCYYLLIALCTWIMSAIHNGTALPLPLYIAFLGGVIVCGTQMIRKEQVWIANLREEQDERKSI